MSKRFVLFDLSDLRSSEFAHWAKHLGTCFKNTFQIYHGKLGRLAVIDKTFFFWLTVYMLNNKNTTW